MTATPPKNPDALDAYNAFLDGQKDYSKREYGHALESFDAAIERGYVSDEAFSLRAVCLQRLKFNREAIDDFRAAISLEPHDCNLYFLRSHSKLALRDYDGAIADLRIAIKLSHFESPLNRMYDELASADGYCRIADLYERHLMQALLSKAIEKQHFASRKEKPAGSASKSRRTGPARALPEPPDGVADPEEIRAERPPPSSSVRALSRVIALTFAIMLVTACWQAYRSSVKAREVTALRAEMGRQAETIQWQNQKLQSLGAIPKVGFRVNPVPIRRAGQVVEK